MESKDTQNTHTQTQTQAYQCHNSALKCRGTFDVERRISIRHELVDSKLVRIMGLPTLCHDHHLLRRLYTAQDERRSHTAGANHSIRFLRVVREQLLFRRYLLLQHATSFDLLDEHYDASQFFFCFLLSMHTVVKVFLETNRST